MQPATLTDQFTPLMATLHKRRVMSHTALEACYEALMDAPAPPDMLRKLRLDGRISTSNDGLTYGITRAEEQALIAAGVVALAPADTYADRPSWKDRPPYAMGQGEELPAPMRPGATDANAIRSVGF